MQFLKDGVQKYSRSFCLDTLCIIFIFYLNVKFARHIQSLS